MTLSVTFYSVAEHQAASIFMDVQDIINSRIGVGLALGLSRLVPARQGEILARWLGSRLAAWHSLPMVQAVKANQWVVSQGELSGAELDRQTTRTFEHTAHSIYEFFRTFRDLQALKAIFRLPDEFFNQVKEAEVLGKGVIIVSIHLGNFDLGIRAAVEKAGSLGLHGLILSVPQPGKGYEWQNEFRRHAQFAIIPASISSYKLAISELERGGIVVSGLDRPQAEAKYKPKFFGRPAAIPVLHVPLALRTRAPVVVVATLLQPDGTYQMLYSDPLIMKPFQDRQQEVIYNAEMVLEVAENYIRRAPEQWAMFYPVWPEAMREMYN